MKLLQALFALYQSANGKKFNSGAAITILATVFQQVFIKQGVDEGQALSMATYIIQGSGVVIMIVGYIHRMIKANQANQVKK
jgi:histidinol-phosphate/aromatic aminotransferase/cobyric acid decarboxylase-like protein